MELLRRPLRYAFLTIEDGLDRVFGSDANPFNNLGALGYYFFWIVAATGIYVFVFFDTGLTEAYESLEALTREQWYLGGVLRSLHRYASDGMVAVMLLHMLREFAYDRYRGARSFSWLTGVPLIWLVVASGITGYWLVWDQLAQYVAQTSAEWLDWLPIFGEPIARNFMSEKHLDGRLFTLIIFLHIGIPLTCLFLMWFHLQRVSYARVNPPRPLAVGTLATLLVLAVLKPATSHAPADLATVPTELGLDWFFLAAYPLVDLWEAGPVWVLALGGTFALMLVPWLPPQRRRPPARVDLANCNGCTRCAEDCPFNAITMMPRSDQSGFEQEAVVNANACVSCGICVGACPTAMPFRRATALVPGIELPDLTLATLRDKVEAAAGKLAGERRVLVFGCRHGVRPQKLAGPETAAIELPCVAMLPPAFVDYVLSKDLADGVMIAGCRDGSCHYRLGVRWMQDRLEGRRDPRLRDRVPRERVAWAWRASTDRRRLEADLAALRQGLPMPGATTLPATETPAGTRREEEEAT